MKDDKRSFEEFMKQREEAARGFVNGDTEALRRVSTHTTPATFFGPKGDYIEGPRKVQDVYEHDSSRFTSGETQFEILHMAASDGLAYWVGFQRATAKLDGQAQAVPMNLRITEIFRREEGGWKMIHRHADMLEGESKEKK